MPQQKPTVRSAKPDDIFALTSVYAETQRATYQGIIPHDALDLAIGRRKPEWWRRNLGSGSTTLILEYDARPEGYVTYGPSRYGDIAYQGEIYEIYIRPAYQGCGFGRQLFESAKKAMGSSGLNGTMLWTIESNEPALAFFRRLQGEPFARDNIMYRTKTLTRIALGWLEANDGTQS